MRSRSRRGILHTESRTGSSATGNKPRGFTLVELLVVISIIGMLMSLVLPAIQSARETGRRITCANNQRNIVFAMMHHESQDNYVPGCMNQIGTLSGPNATPVIASYLVPLFPFLERNDLAAGWTAANPTFPTPYMTILICPSDPPDTTSANHLAFVVNGGVEPSSSQTGGSGPGGAWTVGQKQASGICFDLSPGSNEFIKMNLGYVGQHDGVSHTLLLTENIQADYWSANRWANASQAMFKAKTTFMWKNEVNPSGSWKMNQSKASPPSNSVAFARPSSNHPGGINAFFADGHLKFIGEEIAYLVYRQLMSPNNEGLPGTGAPASATSAEVTAVIDESQF